MTKIYFGKSQLLLQGDIVINISKANKAGGTFVLDCQYKKAEYTESGENLKMNEEIKDLIAAADKAIKEERFDALTEFYTDDAVWIAGQRMCMEMSVENGCVPSIIHTERRCLIKGTLKTSLGETNLPDFNH